MKTNPKMKKSIIASNCVIAMMLLSLVFLSISNTKAINVQADSRVIFAGDESKNNVCFMINVYQGEEYVENILDVLDLYKVKTTFFIGGSWAVKNIDLVKEIYTRGHELGNHGFYHKDQNNLDFDSNIQEIKMCHEVVSKNLGIEMILFAPPSGAYNTTTVDAATSLNYKTIMWTHDTIDWRDQDADLIFNRATKDLSNGDLILMHPTEKSAHAMTSIISTAINNGFNPTTVSNCL
ncbi:MAG: polysaccharide deacetylase family protein [Clostridia bacterium]|nr:polysaccharide deacetylase family protein [Clostridia bacterium]